MIRPVVVQNTVPQTVIVNTIKEVPVIVFKEVPSKPKGQ